MFTNTKNAVMGPFPVTLRGSSFTDATGAAGVSSTSTYTPLCYFRIPLNQMYVFRPSTQMTNQQDYWSQGLVNSVSPFVAATSGTSIRLERRTADGQFVIDVVDWGSAGDIPTIATTSKVSLRYFQKVSQINQDEYLYITVQSTSGQTVAQIGSTTSTSDVLIKGIYYIKTG